MFSAPTKQFARTSIWRSTLVFTLIMSVVCGCLLLTVLRLQDIEQKRTVREQVLTGVQSLTSLALQPDITVDDFIVDVERRARTSSENIIVLKSGDQVYGNLSQWPEGISTFPQMSRFPVAVSSFDGRGDLSHVLASRVQTAFGGMVIGVFEPHSLKSLSGNLIAGLAGLVLLSLLVGYIYNRRALVRLADINHRLGLIEKGQLDTRLPVSHQGDEYDSISEHINAMVQTLANQVDAISTVTDSIAHDLRTPLGRIRLALESMAGEYDDDRILQTLESVDQLIQIFNAMLELSRLERGALALEETSVNLSAVCADAVELAEVLLGENQSLELAITKNVTVAGNAHLLFQAVYNLLENAIRYSGERATIRLHLVVATPPLQAVLSISDDGPGIPGDMYERVFDRLVRLDNSRTTAGFGMGLPLVRAVVQRHRGEIELSPTFPDASSPEKEGPGLTVTVQL